MTRQRRHRSRSASTACYALVVVLAAVAAVPSALAARPSNPALSLSAGSYRVLYGHATVISGRLVGAAVANQRIVVDARRYGTSAPLRAATVRTSSEGRWSLRVTPVIRTMYEAHSGSVTSRRIAVGVAPAVSVKELPNGRLRVQVRGWHAFTGKFVELQRRGSHGTWKTVDRKPLSSASIAVIAPALPTSTVRLAMSINQAGAGYLGAASHPLAYRAVALWVIPAAYKVLFGHGLMLNGRLLNARESQHIVLYARPYGTQSFKPLETLTTTRDGRFQLLVQPTIQTTYQARLGNTRKSLPITVGVEPDVTVLALGPRSLRVHIAAAKPFRGRMVELQRRMSGNTWRTVAKTPLGATSSATFHFTLAHSTIRVAMSVNQAGAGYLGTFSHPLLVPAV